MQYDYSNYQQQHFIDYVGGGRGRWNNNYIWYQFSYAFSQNTSGKMSFKEFLFSLEDFLII